MSLEETRPHHLEKGSKESAQGPQELTMRIEKKSLARSQETWGPILSHQYGGSQHLPHSPSNKLNLLEPRFSYL